MTDHVRIESNQWMSFEAGSPTAIELEPVITPDSITLNNVQLNHQQLMDNNKSVASHTEQIIDILGGIDVVLQSCFAHIGDGLHTEQLKRINNIITSIDSFEQSTRITQHRTAASEQEIDDNPPLIVSTENTFFHKMLKHELASKIISILYSRI
eukprot:84103_1